MPPFLNSIISIISLSPLYLHTLRATADGTASRHQLCPGPYTGEDKAQQKKSNREHNQEHQKPDTQEARHNSRRRQLHHITRKQGREREPGRETASATLTKL